MSTERESEIERKKGKGRVGRGSRFLKIRLSLYRHRKGGRGLEYPLGEEEWGL